jgi:hypothetical protein
MPGGHSFVPPSLWRKILFKLLTNTFPSVDINQVSYSAHLPGTDFHSREKIILLYLINFIYLPNNFNSVSIFIPFLTLLEWKVSVISFFLTLVNNTVIYGICYCFCISLSSEWVASDCARSLHDVHINCILQCVSGLGRNAQVTSASLLHHHTSLRYSSVMNLIALVHC